MMVQSQREAGDEEMKEKEAHFRDVRLGGRKGALSMRSRKMQQRQRRCGVREGAESKPKKS